MQLLAPPDGTLRLVYDEALPLAQIGSLTIQRGSHVEPDHQGNWFVDLTPVQGPRLGPFPVRSQALAAERDWLQQHWLMPETTKIHNSCF